MSTQAIAANLLRLRKDRGLTQELLAKTAGLSRGAYRNLEKGRSQPRSDTLKILSGVLEVPIKELLVPVRALERVRFRSLKRLKSRDQVLAEVTRWLNDFADLEALLNEHPRHVINEIWRELARKKSLDISVVAALARQHFGLNDREPVHDICGLLESRGIKVYSLQVANDAFMGLSVTADDGGPAIIVNTWDRLPVETWIFSAAHELGHLLMHLSAYDSVEEKEDRVQEQEADQFASYFLMPEAIFRKEWDETAGLAMVDRVLKVKRVFRVSWRTVLYRIAQWQPQKQRSLVWQRFNEAYRQRKNRSLLKHDEPYCISREIYQYPMAARPVGVEPAPMERHDFQMDRLSRLVRKAIEKELISLSRGAEILHLPLEQMRELSASWIV